MRSPRTGKFYFFAGLCVIILLYAFYYIFFLYGIAQEMPVRGRHVIKFLFIAGVYGSGLFYLKRGGGGWVLSIWHLVYGSALALLVLLGAYDWAVARTALALREVADDLQELLVSPLLYVALGLLGGIRGAT